MSKRNGKEIEEEENAIRERKLKAKEAEEAMYTNELTRMREERANVTSLANSLVSSIARFEREQQDQIMADISGPDKMEGYISRFNANSKTAAAELQELAASFNAMQTSTDTENVVRPTDGDILPITSSASGAIARASAGMNASSGETKSNLDRASSADPSADGIDAEEDMSTHPMDVNEFKGAAKDALKRKSLATSKLRDLFTAGQKEYNSLVMSMANVDGDAEAAATEALIPMLNRKIVTLTHSVQMSQLKAEAVQVQWLADKERHHDEMYRITKTMEIMDIKLQVATGKKRFVEQTDRDPNMVANVVSQAEFEDIIRQLDAKMAELAAEKVASAEIAAQFASLKTKAYEAGRTQSEDKARINAFDKEMANAKREREKLEKQIAEADTVFAEKQKSILQELERTKDEVKKVQQNAQEENSSLKELTKSLESKVAEYKKAEDGTGEGPLVTGLQGINSRLQSFQKVVFAEEDRIAALLSAQIKRLENLSINAVKAQAGVAELAQEAGGSGSPQERAASRQASRGGNAELQALMREKEAWLQEKAQLEESLVELQNGGGRSPGSPKSRGGRNSPGSPKNSKKNLQSRGTSAANLGGEFGDGFATEIGKEYETGEEYEEEDAIMITDADLEALLAETTATSDRAATGSRHGKRGAKDAANLSSMAKSQMRQEMFTKLRKFANKICAGFGDEEDGDDEENAEQKKKVESLLRTYSAGLMNTIDTMADRAGAILSAVPGRKDGEALVEYDDLANMTEISGLGEEDEFNQRPSTAEEDAELVRLRDMLANGELGTEIGTVRKENFDRLKNKQFGGNDIIELTMMEHYTRFDQGEIDTGLDEKHRIASALPKGVKMEEGFTRPMSSQAQAEAKKQALQVKMMEVLAGDIRKKVIEACTFSELAKYKTNTENDMRLLRSFSALKAIQYYADGGNFMDVLSTHRDVIDKIIMVKGGWKSALEEVKVTIKAKTQSGDLAILPSTEHWPEFFRVKVLEFYKVELQNEYDAFQAKFDAEQSRNEVRLLEEEKKLIAERELREEIARELQELKDRKRRPGRGVKAPHTPDITSVAPLLGSPKSPGNESDAQLLDQLGVTTPVPLPSKPPTPVVALPVSEPKPPPATPKKVIDEDRVVDEDDIVEVVDKTSHVSSKADKALRAMAESEKSAKIVAENKAKKELDDAKDAEEAMFASEEDEGTDGNKKRRPTALELLTWRLHRQADSIALRMLKGESNAVIIAELILHAVENWKEQYIDDALSSLEEALECCDSDPNISLVYDMAELIQMECFPPPREVIEVNDKFEGIVHHIDASKNKTEEEVLSDLGESEDEHADVEAPTTQEVTDITLIKTETETSELQDDKTDVLSTPSPKAEAKPTSPTDEESDEDGVGELVHTKKLKNVKSLPNLKEKNSSEYFQKEKVKIANAWAALDTEKNSWKKTQAITVEHNIKISEKMDLFEQEVDNKKAELLHMEASLQNRQSEIDENQAKFAAADEKWQMETAERALKLTERETALRTASESLASDRAYLATELEQLEAEKKDLAKEWEDFFALENKSTEDLMYEDAVGPTKSYLAKQGSMSQNSVMAAKPKPSVQKNPKDEGEQGMFNNDFHKEDGKVIMDARDLLPKGMTMNEVMKAQFADLDAREAKLLKAQTLFKDSVREDKQRMTKEKLANFKTKSDFAKQLNEVRKEKKELQTRVETVKKEEDDLLLAKKIWQEKKLAEERHMHDLRDRIASQLAAAEKRAHEAAGVLKHAKQTVEEQVSAAIAAAGVSDNRNNYQDEEEDLPITPPPDPVTPPPTAETIEVVVAATEESVKPGLSPLKRMGLLIRKSIDNVNSEALTQAVLAKEEGHTLTDHQASILKAAADGNKSGLSNNLSNLLSAVDVTAKLSRRRKEKAENNKKQKEMQRQVDEKVEMIVRERVMEAIALTQVDLVECSTQTMPMMSSSPVVSNMNSAREVVGVGYSPPSKLVPTLPMQSITDGGEGMDMGTGTEMMSFAQPNMDMEGMLEEKEEEVVVHPLTPPPVLPPGFFLIHCKEGDLQVCPGVTYASFERLPADLIEKVPPRVLYVFRGEGEAYSNGIKRLPQYIPRPKKGMEGTECVSIPASGLEIAPGVKLILGATVPAHLELPCDVHVATIARGAKLPPGMTRVDLDASVNIFSDLLSKIPKGVEMVQSHFAVNLPVGTMIAPDVELCKAPRMAPPLPSTLHFVRRKNGADMPKFLVPVIQLAKEDSDIYVNVKMSEGCVVVKRPAGLSLGLGQELLYRPAGHCLPTGVSAVTIDNYPEELKANNFRNDLFRSFKARGLELIQLRPIIELPDSCCFDKCWYNYPKPAGMVFPPGVNLYRYAGTHGHGSAGILPLFLRPVPLPDIPYGMQLPASVLAAEFMVDLAVTSYLPAGTELQPGLKVISLDKVRPLQVHENPKNPAKSKKDKSSRIKLPVHQVLCERDSESIGLPDLVSKAGTDDLPAGLLMAENMELLSLYVRYELPAGVKMESGVRLGPHVGFAPGTILHGELEVLQVPYGCILDPGTCLVRFLVKGASQLPEGYEQIRYTDSEMATRRLPKGCLLVQVPKLCKLPSNQELAEGITIIDHVDEVRRRQGNYELMRKRGMYSATSENPFDKLVVTTVDPTTGESLSVAQIPVPSGCVIIRREEKHSPLPFGITGILYKSQYPPPLRRFLANNPGGNSSSALDAINIDRRKRGLKPRQAQSVEIATLAPSYSLPVGAELAKGLVVLHKPSWLLPTCQYQWLELVSESALLNCNNASVWQARRVELRPEMIPVDLRANRNKDESENAAAAAAAAAAGDGKTDDNEPYVEPTSTLTVATNDTGSSNQEKSERRGLEAAMLKTQQEGAYLLPADTVLVSIPQYFQVHSWGPNAPGIEAVVQFLGDEQLHNSNATVEENGASNAPPTPLSSLMNPTKEERMKAKLKAELAFKDAAYRFPLPSAHFLVQRPRKVAPPSGMRIGLHPKYTSMQHSFGDLPPGVEIVHLEPSYHLPIGVNVSNTYAVHALACDMAVNALPETSARKEEEKDVTRTRGASFEEKDPTGPATNENTTTTVTSVLEKEESLYGFPLSSCIQFGVGQQIGPGVSVLPHPPGWLSKTNTFLYRSTTVAQNVLDSGFDEAAQFSTRPLCFVKVNVSAAGIQSQLPPGARIHALSRQAVDRFFRKSFSVTDLTPMASRGASAVSSDLFNAYENDGYSLFLIELPIVLPSSRDLLKDGRPNPPKKSKNTVVASASGTEKEPKEQDKDFIQIHTLLRNPLEKDPPPPPTPLPDSVDVEKGLGDGESTVSGIIVSYDDNLQEFDSVDSNPVEGPIFLTMRVNGEGEDQYDENGQEVWDEYPPVILPSELEAFRSRMVEEADAKAKAESVSEGSDGEEEEIIIPKAEELMVSLELAQEEIYSLENENNKLLTSLKEVKLDRIRKVRRLAVYAFRQQNRDKGFLVFRNEIADLKAEIHKCELMIQMKFKESRKLVADKLELKERMQAQIDVLNKQLAHSIDANEVVRLERKNMEADFALKTTIQADHMSALYLDMKNQSRQYIHLITATMLITVEGIMKNLKGNSLATGDALISLNELTAKAKEYNEAAVRLAAQAPPQSVVAGLGPLLNNYVKPGAKGGGAMSDDMDGFQSEVSSLAFDDFSVGAASSDTRQEQLSGSESVMSKSSRSVLSMAGPAVDTRSKTKDSWRFAKQSDRLNDQLNKKKIGLSLQNPVSDARDQESVPIDAQLSKRLLDNIRNIHTPPPGSPDAYRFDHNKIPLPTDADMNPSVLWGGSTFSQSNSQIQSRQSHADDDDISVLSQDSYSNYGAEGSYSKSAGPPLNLGTPSSAKRSTRHQGNIVEQQLQLLEFNSPQRMTPSELASLAEMHQKTRKSGSLVGSMGGSVNSASKSSKKHNIHNPKHDPARALNANSVSSSMSMSLNSIPVTAGTDGLSGVYGKAQQTVIKTSKAELNLNREYIGVAAKMALRQSLPIGGKANAGNQLLRPIRDNHNLQGNPMAVSISVSNDSNRRNNSFARLPSPITDPRARHLSNARGAGVVLGSLLPQNVDSSQMVPMNPLLPGASDVNNGRMPWSSTQLGAQEFPELIEAIDRAMHSARVQGVIQVLESHQKYGGSPGSQRNPIGGSPLTISSGRSRTPMNDERIGADDLSISDARAFTPPFSPALPPHINNERHSSTSGGRGSPVSIPDAPIGSPGAGEYVHEHARGQSSQADIFVKSTKDLFSTLMTQLQEDTEKPMPFAFLQPDINALRSDLQKQHGLANDLGQNIHLVAANEALQAWRQKVEATVFENSAMEKAHYLTALARAESEMLYMTLTRKKQENQIKQMQDVLLTLQQKQLPGSEQHHNFNLPKSTSFDPISVAARELALVTTISDLESSVERLRSAAPFSSATEYMREQGQHAANLKATEQALKLQAMVFKERATKEATRIELGQQLKGQGEDLDEGEKKAIAHYIKTLQSQAKAYIYRASCAKVAYERILTDTVTDMEAYERAIQDVLPKKSLLSLLRWGAVQKDRAVASVAAAATEAAVVSKKIRKPVVQPVRRRPVPPTLDSINSTGSNAEEDTDTPYDPDAAFTAASVGSTMEKVE